MVPRILFLLLLAMNLASAAWWYSRAQQPPAPAPPDDGTPTLVLLSERDSQAMSEAASAAAAQADPSGAVATRICASLGPFKTESDLGRGMDLLTPQVARIQFQESSNVTTRGYWVYLPAYQSRDAALRSARQLNAANVRDYYVVTAGDHENTVSLGLFRDRDNAARRQGQIAALGFPARLEERTEVERVYWIEFEQRDATPPEYAALPDAGRLSLKPRSCG